MADKLTPTGSILTFDPSGTSQTGGFFFKNWAEYEIFTIEGKNAVEHGRKVEEYIRNKKQLEIMVWETSFWWNSKKSQKNLRELVYLNGILAYLGRNTKTKQVLNLEVQEVLNHQLEEVKGLAIEDKKWKFRGKEISTHERDAILVFYVFWVKKLGKIWPWG